MRLMQVFPNNWSQIQMCSLLIIRYVLKLWVKVSPWTSFIENLFPSSNSNQYQSLNPLIGSKWSQITLNWVTKRGYFWTRLWAAQITYPLDGEWTFRLIGYRIPTMCEFHQRKSRIHQRDSYSAVDQQKTW